MKVITEEKLREELGRDSPAYYCIPEGTLLTPAAREYLQQKSIRIIQKERQKQERDLKKTKVKPEEMTSLKDDILVNKAYPVSGKAGQPAGTYCPISGGASGGRRE
jgi:ethanolamine utilization cobalamin adenosyltransferase